MLLLSPAPTWKRIASADRSPILVLLFSLVPLLAVTCGVEAWSLWKFGTRDGTIDRVQKIPLELAMRYGTTHFVLGIVISFLAAWMLHNIASGVHIRHTFRGCYNSIAYAMGPAYLLRLADAWDFLNTWVVLGAAVFLIFSVLYGAIPHVIKPDPAKAFGLYLAGAVTLSASHVAAHIFAVLVLRETLFKGGLGLGILGY
ncbi:MAG TPA: hypothetical protein DCM86_15000 [Verrucomicrobiales bacterium]|nr:hypothetical protein [Verrucomicrobiales bacterium]